MKRLVLIIVIVSVVTFLVSKYGYSDADKELDIESMVTQNEIEDGLTPEDVIRLYLSLNGKGRYVMAYDLLTSEQKRIDTVDNIQKYGEIGLTELEKIIGVQQEGDVSLVTAAVKYTDKGTQEVKYQIQEYVLTKEEEWRLTQQENLSAEQLEKFKGLVVQQINEIKNSEETRKFINDLKVKNAELIGAGTDELFKQANNLQGGLESLIKENEGAIKEGVEDTLNTVKDGLEGGLNGLKESLSDE